MTNQGYPWGTLFCPIPGQLWPVLSQHFTTKLVMRSILLRLYI